MLDVIEKLLILQDRDRKLLRLREELGHIPVERQQLQGKVAAAQAGLEAARHKVKQIESDRKKLELDCPLGEVGAPLQQDMTILSQRRT